MKTSMFNLKHYKWPSIGRFDEFVKSIRYLANKKNISPDEVVIELEGTVKLHGTNAGIVFKYDDENQPYLYPQGRNRVLTVDTDNAGFALYLMGDKEVYNYYFGKLERDFESFPHSCYQECGKLEAVCLFGEWAGENVQNGVAIAELKKFFAPFSVSYYFKTNEGKQVVIHNTDKAMLDRYYDGSNQHVRCFPITLVEPIVKQLRFDEVSLANFTNELIKYTAETETCCPFGKLFGVEGIGEGYVWKVKFPKDNVLSDYLPYMFKVKGEKHSVSKVSKLASVYPEHIENVVKFAEYAVTENRLQQGIEFLKESQLEVTSKNIGVFMRWIANDIMKEESAVLAESGLEWKHVTKPVTNRARQWYLNYFQTNY